MVSDWRGALPKNPSNLNIGGRSVEDMGPLEFFDLFFPWNYVREEVVPATNAELKALKLQETTCGEFKLFFGLWTTMSLNPAYSIRDFFIVPGGKDDMRDCLYNPPYLGDSMSRKQFDDLHSATRLRKDEPPTLY